MCSYCTIWQKGKEKAELKENVTLHMLNVLYWNIYSVYSDSGAYLLVGAEFS